MINVIISAVDIFFTVLSALIIIRAILSMFGMDDGTDKKIRFLYDTTEPLLEPFRKLLDRWQSGIMIDFSPLLALIFLDILKMIIINLLYTIK